MKKGWGLRGNRVNPPAGEVLPGGIGPRSRKKYKQICKEQMKYNADLPPVPETPEEEKNFIGEPYETYTGELFEKTQKGEGLAYASKIMGIVSIVLCCFPLINFTCSGLGLAFGIIAKNKGCTKHTLAGIILCSIGLALDLFGTIISFSLAFQN